MTYFAFLMRFLLLPILILALLSLLDRQKKLRLPRTLSGQSPSVVLAGHLIVVLLYTTPWDNYLVARSVWGYEDGLVAGVILGWVPLEEYVFFVLQTLLVGLWLLWLARRPLFRVGPLRRSDTLRRSSIASAAALWLASLALLTSDPKAFTYLGLILVWGLPPLMLQLWFGADILWQHRHILAAGIGVPTLHLALADTVAIGAGTWSLDATQTLGWFLVAHLPVEEFVFFLLTNSLLSFGMILVLAEASQPRYQALKQKLVEQLSGTSATALRK